METKYYIAVGGQQQGPYTLEELSGMEIYADTLVWKSGMPNWEPAGSIEELTGIVRIQAATPQPPAPMGDVVPTVQRSFLRRHRGWFIALGILVLLCGVMALTNPGKKAYLSETTKYTFFSINLVRWLKSNASNQKAQGEPLLFNTISDILAQALGV